MGSPVELQEDWYGSVAEEIGSVKNRLGEKGQNRYKLNSLLRLAKRVADLSADCNQCQYWQGQVSRLIQGLKQPEQVTPINRGDHQTTIKNITRHLRQEHGLVEKGQYTKRLVFFSTALGVSLIAFGYLLLNFGIALLALSITLPALIVRVIFSFAFGRLLDRRARRKGRLI